MNKATFYGRIIEVSEPRVFTKDREEYSYRTEMPEVFFHKVNLQSVESL